MALKKTFINADEELVIQGKLTIEGNIEQKQYINTIVFDESRLEGDTLIVNSDGFDNAVNASPTSATLSLRSGNDFGNLSFSPTGNIVSNKTFEANIYIPNGASISGNVFTGNAGAANALTSSVSIELSGDITTVSNTFINAGDAISFPITLNTVNSNVGTFGNSTNIPVITVNGKGLITAVSLAEISGTLDFSGDTGTDSLTLLSGTLNFEGGDGITTAVTDDNVEIFVDATVVRTDSDNLINANVQLADNEKLILGTGSDLQIYHDGSDSYIVDNGTGDLLIRAENNLFLKRTNSDETYLSGLVNDAVTLYHNNNPKLATTISGIDVTGTVTSDGLQVTNTATTGTNQEIASFRTASGGGLVIKSSDLSAANPDSIIEPFFDERLKVKTNGNDRLLISNNGDISFYEDTGTTAKFLWDASAESLGIGAASSTHTLEIWRSGGDHLLLGRGGVGTYELGVSSDNALTFEDAGTERMRIDSGGNVAIGSATANHFSTGSATNVLGVKSTSGALISVAATGGSFSGIDLGTDAIRRGGMYSENGSNLTFYTNPTDSGGTITERMRITSSGNVGIGTSPDYPLHVSSTGVVLGLNATSGAVSQRFNENGTARFFLSTLNGSNGLAFVNGDGVSERMRIDASGNVGIGLTNPTQPLTIQADSGAAAIALNGRASDGVSSLSFYANDGTTSQGYVQGRSDSLRVWAASGDFLSFGANGSEAARFDTSGNFLVGKTAANDTDAGFAVRSSDYISIVRDGGVTGIFNRLTSDGSIVDFRKDSTTVGSIGTIAGDLTIGDDDIAIRFDTGSGLVPWDLNANATGGLARDAAIDIGVPSARFKDLYLSGTAYINSTLAIETTADTAANILATTTPYAAVFGGDDAGVVGDAQGILIAGKVDTNRGVAILGEIQSASNDHDMIFAVSSSGATPTERMRIDSGGNLLVNTTSTTVGTSTTEEGFTYIAGQDVQVARENGTVAVFNRWGTSAEGTVVSIKADGVEVGRIGSRAGDLSIGTADTGLNFWDASDKIIPESPSAGTPRDAAIDLGSSGVRFKDLYLSGTLTNDGTGGISIDTDGKVGINETTPLHTLHVKNTGASQYAIVAERSSDNFFLGGIYEDTSGNAEFYLKDSSNTTKVLLDTAGTSYITGGDLGIGIYAPARFLHIQDGLTDGTGTEVIIGGSTNHTPKLYFAEAVTTGNVTHGFQMFADGASTNDFKFYRHDNSVSGAEVFNISRATGKTTFAGEVGFGTLTDDGESISITKFVDEADGISANDNDTTLPTSAAVKDYVDTLVTAQDLDFQGDSGTGAVDIDSQTLDIAGGRGIDTTASGQQLTVDVDSTVVLTDRDASLANAYTFDGTVDLSNATVPGFTVTGNLEVTGNINSLTITDSYIEDTKIVLNANAASNSNTQIISNRPQSTNVDIRWNETADKWQFTNDGSLYQNFVGLLDLSVDDTGGDGSLSYSNTTGVFTYTGPDQTEANARVTAAPEQVRAHLVGGDGIQAIAVTDGIIDVDSTVLRTSGDFSVAGNTSITGNVNYGDNSKASFGDSQDLQIYHDGTNGFIENSTGILYIRDTAGGDVRIQGKSGEQSANFHDDGNVELFYDSAKKFETTATGIDVTGTVTADGLTVEGDMLITEASPTITFTDTTDSSQHLLQSINSTFNIQGQSIVRLSTVATKRFDIDNNGDISFYEDTGTTAKLFWDASANTFIFSDNATASFGTGEDLKIFHDSSDSYIQDSGTGNLYIDSNAVYIRNAAGTEAMIDVLSDNAVKLYYNNSERLRTDGNGVITSAMVRIDGTQPKLRLFETDVADENKEILLSAGDLYVRNISDANIAGTNIFSVTNEGNINLYDNAGIIKGVWASDTERLGIGVTDPATSLVVLGPNDGTGGITLTSSDTNNTQKTGRIKTQHYSSAEESVTALYTVSNLTENLINIGGSSGGENAATEIRFWTAADTTTLTGTQRMTIDAAGNVGIKVSDPTQTLEVNGGIKTTTSFAAEESADSAYFDFASGARITSKGPDVSTKGQFSILQQASDGSAPNTALLIDANSDFTLTQAESTLIQDINGNANNHKFVTNFAGNSAYHEFNAGGDAAEKYVIGYGASHGSLAHMLAMKATNAAGNVAFFTGGDNERMRIDETGNIAIGVTSTSSGFEIARDATRDYKFRTTTDVDLRDALKIVHDFDKDIGLQISNSADAFGIWIDGAVDGALQFTPGTGTTASFELMQDGNVHVVNKLGIGSATPAHDLDIDRASGEVKIRLITRDDASNVGILFGDNSDGDVGQVYYNHTTNHMAFHTNATEHMRINSSGHVLVSKTATDFNFVGVELRADGKIAATTNSDIALTANRKTTDGVVAQFRTDNVVGGNIEIHSDEMSLGSANTYIKFDPVNEIIIPRGRANGQRDGEISLGNASNRFRDLHLSGNANIDGDTTIAGTTTISDTGTFILDSQASTTANAMYSDGVDAWIYIGGIARKITPAVDAGDVETPTDAVTGTPIYAGQRVDGLTVYHGIKNIIAGDGQQLSESANVVTITGRSDSNVRGLFSAVDNEGDGTFSYDPNTGQFSYAGISDANVRLKISSTGLIDYDNSTGVISTTADHYNAWTVTTDSGAGSTHSITANSDIQIVGGTNMTVTNSGNVITITNDNTADITSVGAGSGLTGGGNDGDVTLNVVGGHGITVNNDNIEVANADLESHFNLYPEKTGVSTSAITQVDLDTFATADFRTAKYLIQITDSTASEYQSCEILLIHDDSTTFMTEYAILFTGASALAQFDSDINAGNVRLRITPASTNNMQFTFTKMHMDV